LLQTLYCRRCGCRLASDHSEEEWCSPCLRSRRDYEPREDPAFRNLVLLCLSERPGETIDPLRAMGLHDDHRGAVKDAVRALRRQGHVIVATERVAGYKWLGHTPIGHTAEQIAFDIEAAAE
jgi:hypothetical protein